MTQQASDLVIVEAIEDENSSIKSEMEGPFQEGRWMKNEHDRFLIGIMEFGKDWKEVEKIVKTRTGSQVRSHAQKYFIKLNKIRKERKKQKCKLPPEPTEIEKEVISRFTEDDISEKTPSEFIFLIKEAASGSAKVNLKKLVCTLENRKSTLEDKINQAQEKEVEEKKKITHLRDEVNLLKETKNFLEVFSCYEEEPEQSYLVWVMKNKIPPGHQFKDLIDYQDENSRQNSSQFKTPRKNKQGPFEIHNEEGEQEITRIRKKSFTPIDEHDDDWKLKQSLSKLRKIDECEK